VTGAKAPIRVLIADDAVVVRRLLTSVINEDPELEVVGVAHNGAMAVTKAQQLQPDIITLDIEMPEMDGLEALAAIRSTNRTIPIIMFSTLTERGAASTLEALSLGASDYVTKPANVGSVGAAMERVRLDLIPKIKALCSRAAAPTISTRPRTSASAVVPAAPVRRVVDRTGSAGRIDVVAIGCSTGGPVALATVLAGLPADLRVPVVVTQHMPPVFTRLLSQRLDGSVPMRVREAVTGDVLEPGLVLVAPGDFHMRFERGVASTTVRLDQGDPVNFCRPAVDVMFDSVAAAFGGHALAVVLTGMGHDGRGGCATLKAAGARVVAQDEATSVVWGMPGAVVQAGSADVQLPLDDIGPKIVAMIAASARVAAVAR
jgi:two-component system chemotaxis response regulator CheB